MSLSLIFQHFLQFSILFLPGIAENWNWNWGNQPPPPPMPNNNVAIGYPTAYGLYTGRGYGNNNYGNGGPPNAGAGFGSPLRCLNGGAHIGQCRLDKDSICIALGGTCTHGACCTTPFVSILGGTMMTTEIPEVIDGETTKRKGKGKGRRVTVGSSTTVIPKNSEEEERGSDEMNSIELEEWNRLVEQSKTTSAPEPITVSAVVEENEDRKCSSGLRSVGPCSEDSDCPTLHQCESEQCCYLVI